jgi:hypothetical protein
MRLWLMGVVICLGGLRLQQQRQQKQQLSNSSSRA